MSGDADMLRIEDIHTYYGDSYIIQGISLSLQKGSITAILGRNGMGKTTLIRTIIGFMNPRRGKVFFKDRDITGLPSYNRVRMGLGLVPQGRRVFRSLTVRENLMAAVINDCGKRNFERVCETFPRLKERLNQQSSSLSGGEQQMLAVGRALMGSPQLLLMDEPTEGLSPLFVQTVGDTILRLKQEGFSILLVEQNMPLALQVADYIHVISRGRVVHSSSPADLRDNQDIKSRYLGI
jgi:branched-chain amino acid transport system ATP-binding protein